MKMETAPDPSPTSLQDLALQYFEKGVSTETDPTIHFTNDRIVDLTSFDGHSYLPQSPTINWPGGRFKTKLPYIPSITDANVNLLKADAAHVEHLARSATVTSKLVVKLTYGDYGNDRDFSLAIANEIKWGRTVVVTGHPYKATSCSIDDLNLRFNFTSDIEVVALGAFYTFKIQS
jgi:hypothetical protein